MIFKQELSPQNGHHTPLLCFHSASFLPKSTRMESNVPKKKSIKGLTCLKLKFRYSEKAQKKLAHLPFIIWHYYNWYQIKSGRWAKFLWPSQNIWTLILWIKVCNSGAPCVSVTVIWSDSPGIVGDPSFVLSITHEFTEWNNSLK